jgi:hypothetical protein
MTRIRLQDNDLANKNKHVCDFNIRSLTDMINYDFQQFGILGEFLSVDEMIVKYLNSLGQFFCGNQKCLVVTFGIFVVQGGYCFNSIL